MIIAEVSLFSETKYTISPNCEMLKLPVTIADKMLFNELAVSFEYLSAICENAILYKFGKFMELAILNSMQFFSLPLTFIPISAFKIFK